MAYGPPGDFAANSRHRLTPNFVFLSLYKQRKLGQIATHAPASHPVRLLPETAEVITWIIEMEMVLQLDPGQIWRADTA
ncbi:hypothetical protein Q9L58_007625 [Maublancomyces gigas]|uniref:Uncharacterized protein n=1 Tax=Discina gigas TaxID=1032678 RepID=A0ABR3GC13_9PEZI